MSCAWGVLRCIDTGQRYVLKADEIRIGREKSCQIQLPVTLTLASKVMQLSDLEDFFLPDLASSFSFVYRFIVS
jgi:hypothetical protein